MSKYYIAVDMEGLACVVGSYGAGLPADSAGYAFAREQATAEANAAATALFDSGAEEVWVWDNHGTGFNLKYNELDKRVKIVIGAGSKKRFPGITPKFDGVLFIGYHAYDTPYATLAHVYSSATFQSQKINGIEVGEMQIDAAIAGRAGVPPIFASSDDICLSQAKASFSGIVTVETKKALAWNSCISKHPRQVCDEIYEKVKDAAANAHRMKTFSFAEPIEYEVRYKRTEYAVGSSLRDIYNRPFALTDAYTRSGKLARVEDIFEF